MPRNLGFLETFPVLTALPTSVGSGRIVTLSTDGHPYFDHATGWLRMDNQPPAIPGDMLKSVYDTNNDGKIDVGALGTGTASITTYLRGDNSWGSLPRPVSALPPLDAQSALFPRLVNGTLNGQQGWVVGGTATATVAGPVVSVVGDYGTQANVVLSPREFTTGVIRFQVNGAAAGQNFMVTWGNTAAAPSSPYFAVYTGGTNIEVGQITANGGGIVSYFSVANVVFTTRYTVEVVFNGQAATSRLEVRSWPDGSPRPAFPNGTYVFTGSEPAVTGTRVALRCIGTTPIQYSNLEVVDAVTNLRNQTLPSGYWFPYVYGGTTQLVTINQGARLDTIVQGTLNLSVNINQNNQVTYFPKIAFRVDGGPLIYRTIAGTGLQTITISLPDAGIHRVAIIAAGINGTDSVWTQGQGLAITSVTVDAGGQISRPPDDRPITAHVGDSILGGHLVYGQNGTAPISTPSQSAGEIAYPMILASRQNTRVNQHGFAGIGVTTAGDGSVPKAATSFLNYQSGIGLYGEDIPTTMFVNLGINDSAAAAATMQSEYLALIDAVRLRYPALTIILMVPISGTQATVIQTVAALRGLQLVDASTWTGVTLSDGIHPTPAGHNRMAELLGPYQTGAMNRAVYDSNGDGRIDAGALGTGTSAVNTYLRGDNSWGYMPGRVDSIQNYGAINQATWDTSFANAVNAMVTLGTVHFPQNATGNMVYYFTSLPDLSPINFSFDPGVVLSVPSVSGISLSPWKIRQAVTVTARDRTNSILLAPNVQSPTHLASVASGDIARVIGAPKLNAVDMTTLLRVQRYLINNTRNTGVSTLSTRQAVWAQSSFSGTANAVDSVLTPVTSGMYLSASLEGPATGRAGVLLEEADGGFWFVSTGAGSFIGHSTAAGVWTENNAAAIPTSAYDSAGGALAEYQIRIVGPREFEVSINGWRWARQVTAADLRTAGWAFYNYGNASGPQYAYDAVSGSTPAAHIASDLSIVIMGDSLLSAEGTNFGALDTMRLALEGELGLPRIVYINRATAGENAASQRARMDAGGAAGSQIVIIAVGTNDIQGSTTLSSFETDVRAMVTRAQADGARVVLEPPPMYISQALAGGNGALTGAFDRGGHYRSILRRIAADTTSWLADSSAAQGPMSVANAAVIKRDNLHNTIRGDTMRGRELARAIILALASSAVQTGRLTLTISVSLPLTDGELIVRADASAGALNFTLPSAAAFLGRYTVKKIDSTGNTVTLATTASQTIDGGATAVLGTQYLSLTVVSDGSNWMVL